jgi:hypothetical protein
MSNTYSYPDDDEFARKYIAAHTAALPIATLASPGDPRLWQLAAQAAGVVAIVKAMAAASAPPVNPGPVV